MARRRLLPAALAALAALTAACASIPATSQVREVGEAVGEAPDLSVGVYARPPQPDAIPAEIVKGFLEASGAVNFEVARDYLAPDVEWAPATVVIYDDSRVTHIPDADEDVGQVRFTATKVAELDERHAFTPAVGDDRPLDETFTLTRADDDQWRISGAPDRLLISETDFKLQYRSYNRYFFEPSHTILVPDPIYVRDADQDVLAARLVHSLLHGPTGWLAPAVTPAVPSGIQCASDPDTCAGDVTIEAGIATVRLASGGDGLNPKQRSDLLAQLVWTLNELDVDEVLVVVDGLPVSGQRRNIEAFSDVRPTGSGQSAAIRRAYILVDGRLMTQALDQPQAAPTPVTGPFAAANTPKLTAFAVALKGGLIAAVAEDGNAYVFPEGTSEQVKPVLSGANLRSPYWDGFGRLWIVDGSPGDSQVRVWDHNNGVEAVDMPGLNGDIEQLAVSDDGTRVALVVADGSRSGHVEMRVVRHAGDTVELAHPRPLAPELADATDVAWQNAEMLVVLGSQSSSSTEAGAGDQSGSPVQPYLVAVDSSAVQPQGIAAEESVSVAAAPNLPILVGTAKGRIFQYADGVWTDIGKGANPGYAG